jgi:hypothetical protein
MLVTLKSWRRSSTSKSQIRYLIVQFLSGVDVESSNRVKGMEGVEEDVETGTAPEQQQQQQLPKQMFDSWLPVYAFILSMLVSQGAVVGWHVGK